MRDDSQSAQPDSLADDELDTLETDDDFNDDPAAYNIDDVDDGEEIADDDDDTDDDGDDELDGPTPAMPGGELDSGDVAQYIAALLDDKKASNIIVLDIRNVSIIADYFVIATGTGERQVKALAREIDRQLSKRDISPVHKEGTLQGRWILLDYSDVVVHLFTQAERDFYSLERLWGNARTVVVYQ